VKMLVALTGWYSDGLYSDGRYSDKCGLGLGLFLSVFHIGLSPFFLKTGLKTFIGNRNSVHGNSDHRNTDTELLVAGFCCFLRAQLRIQYN